MMPPRSRSFNFGLLPFALLLALLLPPSAILVAGEAVEEEDVNNVAWVPSVEDIDCDTRVCQDALQLALRPECTHQCLAVTLRQADALMIMRSAQGEMEERMMEPQLLGQDDGPFEDVKRASFVRMGKKKRASFVRMGKKKRASFVRMGKKKRASFVRMGKKKRASFVRMGKKKRASFVRMGKKKRASFVRMGKKKRASLVRMGKKRAAFLRMGKRETDGFEGE